MNRQNTARRMFGLIMLTVTLLLVACGSGDGDATPTPTAETNAAVPTLPVDEATAETQEISGEDLTVVTPDLPATASIDENVATIVASPTVAESTPVDAAALGTPPDVVPSTPPVESAPLTSTPAATENATPAAVAVEGTAIADPGVTAATPAPEGGTFITPGDGTGGSGQPGERSSNIPGEEDVVASPIAFLTVEGCDVPEVPAFTGASTAYVTNAEVNFRSGPGTDCPAILEAPLAEDVAVVVLGGPVTQGADGSNWLQVEVDGVPGWVSLEFVEPAE